MRVSRVTGRGRVQFLGAVPSECRPSEHGCIDTYAGRLTPGELVAVHSAYQGYACVEALGRNRFGWVPQSRLKVEPDRPPPATWWIGSWKDKLGPTLTIERRHGQLYVDGGNEQIGDREAGFDGVAEASGAGLRVWQEGDDGPPTPGGPPCFAKLVRLGDVIVVHTAGCFPTNFSGFFTRQ